jgi:hypothetical protein
MELVIEQGASKAVNTYKMFYPNGWDDIQKSSE